MTTFKLHKSLQVRKQKSYLIVRQGNANACLPTSISGGERVFFFLSLAERCWDMCWLPAEGMRRQLIMRKRHTDATRSERPVIKETTQKIEASQASSDRSLLPLPPSLFFCRCSLVFPVSPFCTKQFSQAAAAVLLGWSVSRIAAAFLSLLVLPAHRPPLSPSVLFSFKIKRRKTKQQQPVHLTRLCCPPLLHSQPGHRVRHNMEHLNLSLSI